MEDPHIIRCFFLWLHHDTVCVGEVQERGFLWKVEAALELFEAGLPVAGHLGFVVGCPTPSKGHRVYELLEKPLQLAHGSQTCTLSLFHLSSMMETHPFFIRRSSPFLHTEIAEVALLVNQSSHSIIVTKTSKSLTSTAASSVDSASLYAVVMTVVFFGFFDGIEVVRSFSSHGEMRCCPQYERDASGGRKFCICLDISSFDIACSCASSIFRAISSDLFV